jgi:polysaccharide pyruvyl transferase WcaK-like protein
MDSGGIIGYLCVMDRRTFLSTTTASLLATSLQAAVGARPRILLRSSWQIVNIGDIAHTPGVLALLERYLPEADVALWTSRDMTTPVMQVLRRRFPDLRIVRGTIGARGASTPELAAEVEQADFLLHGSGPSFVAAADTAAFVKYTGKPFGVYGITYSGAGESQRELLSQARFLFFRDTVSLALARSEGIAAPIMEFGPDGAFACDLVNDVAADEFLELRKLTPGKFVCCIPRLRYTPFWLIKSGVAFNPERHARNEATRVDDHAPLREAICRIVEETDLQVLVCPEDMTQMSIGKQNIVDLLPPEVLPRVVWRPDYWLTDEAVTVYRRSAGLFGLEMHSPIMCIGNGIPAIVGRFAEQTSKGLMWRDIGLEDWLFDIDDPERRAKYAETVLHMVQNPAAARDKVQAARQIVQRRQEETMAVVQAALPSR